MERGGGDGAMGAIEEILKDNSLAALFGMAGLACQLLWPLFRTQRTILLLQFGIGADYSIQYALLDAWSGAGVAALGATQTAFALLAGSSPIKKLGFAFLPAAAAICFATWSGVESFFALIAVTLVMLGRMQEDTLRLRILLLAAAPFGMGYDILTGALPALIGGIVSAAIATTMLANEIRSRRKARLSNSFIGQGA
jgi:hypothetical protein